MRVQASVPSRAQVPEGPTVPEALLEAVIRGVTHALYGHGSQQAARAETEDSRPDLPPLLKPEQVKELTGWSRNTVDRMIDEGDLPHICAREGARQRMRQVPKAFVLQMMADLKRGVSIPDMKAYAKQWHEIVVGQPPTHRPPVPSAPVYATEVA
jgi:hypothetical protein